MEATTIKVHSSTKHALDEFGAENESYDEIISKLLNEVKRKELRQLLIEGYQQNQQRDSRMAEEWEMVSSGLE